MPKTVFFSWQSDTPASNDKSFLKEALEQACADIAIDTTVDEALRDIQVDSDTQGVAGQPPIVDTIFKKIDAAGVFIADMTFVGTRTLDGRPTPNPNVLIEYGWALKALKHERVMCVMNTEYGTPTRENLPFDLSHLRFPITYSLPPKAPLTVKEKVKKALVTILTKAIRESMATIPTPSIEPPQEKAHPTVFSC